jgi:hypothetical protein
MKPLTATQRAILRDAAAHPHDLAAPPANLPPAPRMAIAKALLGAALLAPAEGDEGRDPGLAWKLDGESVLLRITEAGLSAVGAEPAGQAAAAAQEGAEAAAEAPDAAAASHDGLGGRPGRSGGAAKADPAAGAPRRRAGGARRLG